MPSLARLLAAAALLSVPLWPTPAHAAPATSAASTGVIKGIVRNKNGEAQGGATVLLSCTCIQGERQTTANNNGLYRFRDLPAGLYTVRAIYNNAWKDMEVELGRGQSRTRDVRITDSKNEERKLRVGGGVNPVRTDSAGGIKLKAGDIDLIGGGGANRSATEGAVMQTVGGGRDAGGVTTGGASSAEVNAVKSGLRVSNPVTGMSTLSSPSEFIGYVEVLDGGMSAEFGQSSGGRVSSRRVSGGNKVRGTARFTFTPRLGEPRTIVGTDDAIRAVETPDYGMQGIVSTSGPFVGRDPKTALGKKLQDRLFWNAGVFLKGARSTLRQTYHRRIDKNGSGGYDHCPYENGAGDCEEGKDYLATEQFGGQRFRTRGVGGQAQFGLDFLVSRKHRLAATYWVEPNFQYRAYRRPLASVDPDALGASPDAAIGGAATVANGLVNDHRGWDRSGVHGGVLEYTGRVANDNIEIDASVGYLQTKYEEAWKLDDPRHKLTPATQYNNAQGANLFALLDAEGGGLDRVGGVNEACNSADLPGLTCPVRAWLSGGLGQYTQLDRSRRIQADLSLTHFFNGAGAHQLKYGSQFEHLSRHRVLKYSGQNEGDFYDNCAAVGLTGGGEWCFDESTQSYDDLAVNRVNNNRQSFVGANDPNTRRTRGFGRVQRERNELRAIADPLGNGARVEAYDARVSTQNYAAFLQDRWAITNSLFVDAGVRWEMQDMRDLLGRPAIRMWDNFAPRVGLVYDWTQEGKSRLYANYGWFYQQMPLALINRVYGGLVNVVRTYDHAECNGNSVRGPDGGSRQQVINGQPTEWCTDFGEITTGLLAGATVPRLRGQFDQVFQVGYQHEIIEDLTLEVRWMHRELGRAVEDISPDGGNNFIVANPGVDVSAEDRAAQQSECDQLNAQLGKTPEDDAGYGALAREAARCDFLVKAYEAVGRDFVKPTRNYDAFSLQLVKRWANNWLVLGSYTYSRFVGNYGGFVDPNTGAVNVGAASQYDLPELVRNNFGPLPNDVRHRLNLNGAYRFDMGEIGALSIGGGVLFNSGRPVSVRAGHTRYLGEFPTHLIARGMGGRLSPNYQVTGRVEYSYPLGDSMNLSASIRLLNLTNAKATLRVDDVYTFDNARPIAGGDRSDVKHAKVQDPQRPTEHFERNIVQPQGNYLVETAFQLPLTAQFDVRLSF